MRSTSERKRSNGALKLWARVSKTPGAGQSSAPPPDGSAPEQRSRERYRRIASGVTVGVGSRAATMLSAVISVPLILDRYGSERFAIWATLNSFLLLLAFSDLGLSHGLVNLLGEDDQRHRPEAIRYVSSAYALLGGIGIVLSIAFAVAYPFVVWGDVFGVRSAAAVHQAAPAALIFALCFLLNMVLSLTQNIRVAYQETAAAYGWVIAGSILSLLALGVVVATDGSFPLAIAATCGGPVVASALSSLTLFGHRRPWLRPRTASVSRLAARRLLRTGGMFFVLQASAAIAYQSDALIIAQVRGAQAVTRYMIPFRLFAFLPSTLIVALMPFWPAFRSAIRTGDGRWAARGLRHSIMIGLLIIVPLAGLLAIFASPLLELWTGRTQNPGFGLLAGLAVWAILSAVATPLWTFLIAAGALRPLAWMAASMAVVNVALSIALTRLIGIRGAIYGTDIAQVVFLVVPGAIYARRLIRTLHAGDDASAEPRAGHAVRRRLSAAWQTKAAARGGAAPGEDKLGTLGWVIAAAALGAAIPYAPGVVVVPFLLLLLWCAWRWPAMTVSLAIAAAALHSGIFLSIRLNAGGAPLSIFDVVPLLVFVSALSVRQKEPAASQDVRGPLKLAVCLVAAGTVLGALIGFTQSNPSYLILRALRLEVELLLVLIACLTAGSSSQWRKAVVRGIVWAAVLASVEILGDFFFTILTGSSLWSLFPFGDQIENVQGAIATGQSSVLRQNAVAAYPILPALALVATRLGRRDGILTGLFLSAGVAWLSRSFWSALAAMMVIVVVFHLRDGHSISAGHALKRLAPVVPMALVLAVLGGAILQERLSVATSGATNTSNEFRVAETQAALDRVTGSPFNFVFGLGAGTLVDHPFTNGAPLSPLLENGVLSEWVNGGLALMLGSALLFFVAGVRGWSFAARAGPEGARGALGLLSLALPVLWIEGLVGGTLQVIEPTTILWILAGTALAQLPPKGSERTISVRLPRPTRDYIRSPVDLGVNRSHVFGGIDVDGHRKQ